MNAANVPPEPGSRISWSARYWKRLLLLLMTLLLLGAVGLFAIGWHFSSVIGTDGFRVVHSAASSTLRVDSEDQSSMTLSPLPNSVDADNLVFNGQWGLDAEHGYARLGSVLSTGNGSVTRQLLSVAGVIAPGDEGRLDRADFPNDPSTALGLPYENVDVQSSLGPMPAWLFPGDSSTWAILIHGWRSTRADTLRIVPIFADAGVPAMVISYRNDEGVPQDPSGRYQFGLTEWQDVESAVTYAVDHGAKNVVLVGYSMGGGTAVNFMYQSKLAPRVKALVLDSPLMDFGRSVDFGAQQRGIPGIVTWVAKRLSSIRFGANWGAMDYFTKLQEIHIPVLLFQGDQDTRVPKSSSDDLARALGPQLVDYEFFPGAQHVGSWNVDPSRYDSDLQGFLTRVLQP